ncbi:brain and acute leukemia cytoplasmic protein-like [Carassius auratus]|uniref:Brain and acute leukemia cytoplasmic protein-like n=1 Tax=Carassius auratus TaxID=7957 RepID=A0A6P6LGD1_CARAU|nr:brain and acute leukemia cytoplasmic protein-like [Carassius auratus]
MRARVHEDASMGSMGCGGSRSATIEPRYYESRDTESTWLTSTDTDTQRAAGTGTGESASDDDKTAAGAASDQKEEKPVTRSSSAKEKKLVNAGTQCGRNPGGTPRRPAHRDQDKSKSKTTPQKDVVKSVRSDCKHRGDALT